MQLKWPMLWDLFSLFPAHAGVILYICFLAVNFVHLFCDIACNISIGFRRCLCYLYLTHAP